MQKLLKKTVFFLLLLFINANGADKRTERIAWLMQMLTLSPTHAELLQQSHELRSANNTPRTLCAENLAQTLEKINNELDTNHEAKDAIAWHVDELKKIKNSKE